MIISELGHYATRFSKVLRNEGVTRPAANKTLQGLTHDAVEFSSVVKAKDMQRNGVTLSEGLIKAFDEVIPQIKPRNTEIGIAYTSQGEKLAEATGTHLGIEPQGKINEKALSANGTLASIHNHPLETPMSPDDLSNLFLGLYDTIAMVSKDGGHSVIQKTRDLTQDDFKKVAAHGATEMLLVKKLQRQNLSKMQVLQGLNKYREAQLPNIAKEMGCNYYYQPGKLNPKNIPAHELPVPVKEFCDNAGITEESFNEITDKIPMSFFEKLPSFKEIRDMVREKKHPA